MKGLKSLESVTFPHMGETKEEFKAWYEQWEAKQPKPLGKSARYLLEMFKFGGHAQSAADTPELLKIVDGSVLKTHPDYWCNAHRQGKCDCRDRECREQQKEFMGTQQEGDSL